MKVILFLLSKTHILFYIVTISALFVLYKTIDLPKQGKIQIEIQKQKGNIKTIDTVKKIAYSKSFKIDKLIFPHTNALYHKQHGKLGFTHNFFIVARTQIDVLEKGWYRFIVHSDDGFRMKIDDKFLCEHTKDRAYSKSVCDAILTKGTHKLKFEYFQAGGPLGFHVEYGLNGKNLYTLGNDSSKIIFKEPTIDYSK